MALEVIGSGLGRTGTKSLQTALEILGFGPCYHMVEVFKTPGRMAQWIAAGEGRPDWEAIFAGYRSAVDYPSAAYWRELAHVYPEALVLHSERDPDAWFASTQATIFAPELFTMQSIAAGNEAGQFFRSFMDPFLAIIHDRDAMIAHFRRHNAEVRATIPAERLLVHEPGQGWEPLCAFLGVPVPDEAYPAENSREAFIGRAATLGQAQ